MIMRKSISTILICAGLSSVAANAQSPEATIKEKMKIFSVWVGRWQGEGSIQMGPGEPKKSKVEEKIESKLEGTVLLIEGIGKAPDPATKQEAVVHHALGIVSFDPASGQYKLRSHLKDGRSTDAWLITTGENKFQWGFDIPGRGKTRYSIALDPAAKTWNEIGEYSADGNTWSKFFEMNLKKIE
jgi:hypothetical protein